jgi:hypothetical protein
MDLVYAKTVDYINVETGKIIKDKMADDCQNICCWKCGFIVGSDEDEDDIECETRGVAGKEGSYDKIKKRFEQHIRKNDDDGMEQLCAECRPMMINGLIVKYEDDYYHNNNNNEMTHPQNK